jgi:DNA-binding NtrC family response regulator
MVPFSILIIEDDHLIRTLITEVLSAEGTGPDDPWRVESATNGREALERHSATPFDLFILDFSLPGMSGAEILRQLNPREHDYEIVIISGLHDLETAQTCIQLGAFDYLSKPFPMGNLVEAVKKARQKIKGKNENQAYIHTLQETLRAKENDVALLSSVTESERARLCAGRNAGTHPECRGTPAPHGGQAGDRVQRPMRGQGNLDHG